MPYEYSEDKLIEQTAIGIFFDKLGWDVNNAYDNEIFGENGTLGRYMNSEVILKQRLLSAIKRLNPTLPEEAHLKAIEILQGETSYQSLVDINHDKYELFINGIKVSYKNHRNELVRDKTVRIFDFENAANNDFLAVQQLWIQGRTYLRRPDIIGYVNGIPLLFIELKAVHRNLRSAYDGNLSDYKDTIPKLFYYNAFILLSNGIDTKIGSITSRYEHFNEWKRITEDEEGIVSLETALLGICDKQRFMDLFENFILFDSSTGKTIKLIARNHQYLGVNNAIESVKKAEESEGRLGVFWHTQGSGKSYSMIFFTQKILRKVEGSYSFVIVTDREELDKQIYGTFTGTGAVTEKNVRATSGKHLSELLKENHRYVFSLIHKFITPDLITDRSNVIVISDEAHRTQQGTLALNMRNALPKSSFIGFTGTPLIKGEDEITRNIFGDYVSVYNFKRSVEDNSTVPLYYENRGEFLKLENPNINEEMRSVVEELDLDPDQTEKLKRLFLRDYPIFTAEKRLRAIANDIVWHFNNRGYKGKAMVVCLDKITAVRMYDFIQQYWADFTRSKEKELKRIDDEQSAIELQKEIKFLNNTEIAVVVSEEQNEVAKFRKWGLEIEPHRKKMKQRDLERDFKDDEHPFRLVIVCAMWITGFDVQSLSTLYLDKPLKGHTLMQTIARANRVYKGKNNGLIVDYIETYKNLLEALSIYGQPETDERPEPPIGEQTELAEQLQEVIRLTEEFLSEQYFNLDVIISSQGSEKIAAIANGVNAICRNDVTRTKYSLLAKRVFAKFRALAPNPMVNPFRSKKEAIQVLFNKIEGAVDEADVTDEIKALQKIVDESIFTAFEPSLDFGKQFDISTIDFDLLSKEFEKASHKNTAVQQLKTVIEKKLNKMLAANPFRADFQKRYNEIIDEYNLGKDEVTLRKTFDRLKKFMESLGEEERRVIREGLSEEHLALFDLLCKPEISAKEREKVKRLSIELLDTLKAEKLKIDNWRDKSQIAAAVRTEILNKLFNELPYPTYATDEVNRLTNSVYWYMWNRYPNFKYEQI